APVNGLLATTYAGAKPARVNHGEGSCAPAVRAAISATHAARTDRRKSPAAIDGVAAARLPPAAAMGQGMRGFNPTEKAGTLLHPTFNARLHLSWERNPEPTRTTP